MINSGFYWVLSGQVQNDAGFFKRAAVEMGDFFMDKNDANYVLFPVT